MDLNNKNDSSHSSSNNSYNSEFNSPNPPRNEVYPTNQPYSPYQTFSPYVPQTMSFNQTHAPQFPSQNPYPDLSQVPLHRRKRKFQNISYDRLLSEEDLTSMTVEEFEDYVNELKERRTLSKTEKATLNKIKRKLKNKESARKSRLKSKEAFTQLQQELQEIKKQYDEVLRINIKLVEVADGCERCRQKIREAQQNGTHQSVMDTQTQSSQIGGY